MSIKNKMKVISFIVLAMTVAYMFYDGILWFNYPSKKEYPMRGIDISHHQGAIDWNALKSEKIDFIYMKATEGGDYVDGRFITNWENAKNAGYTIGAYHFYRLCTDWDAQVKNMIKTIPATSSMLPVVLDLEYMGNCKTAKSKKDILVDLQLTVDALEKHFGERPIFYVTEEFYENYIMGELEDISLWYRDIFKTPKILDGRNWLFWQYSNRGHLDGIEGYVDLNVFHGNKEAFSKLISSK